MLKELNVLAEALLGLEGYPTKPLWTDEAPRRDAQADRHPSTVAFACGVPANVGATCRPASCC